MTTEILERLIYTVSSFDVELSYRAGPVRASDPGGMTAERLLSSFRAHAARILGQMLWGRVSNVLFSASGLPERYGRVRPI
jgi:hypothetical protein